jgi:ADP-ribose pyrophosphatase
MMENSGRRERKVWIEREQVVFDGFFQLKEATLRYERFDGQPSTPVRRLKLERGDSVAALVRNTDTGKVLLVEQFKYPTYGKGDGWILETVAGMVDEGESFDQAMRREVREEIGYELRSLQPIATFYVSPGGSSERVALFYGEVDDAGRVGAGGGVATEGEDIELREFSLDELWEAVDAGAIDDAKTLIGLLWLRARAGGAG